MKRFVFSGDGQIFQVWSYLNLLIIIKLPFFSKNMSKFFPLPLPSKTCPSLRFRVRKRPEKYFLLSAWHRELYGPGPELLYRLIDTNTYTLNLLVCNSDLAIVTALYNFFFVLQGLIDRIDSYFQRVALLRNLLLIGF